MDLDCGNFEEILSLREYEAKGLTCPTCAGEAQTVIYPVRTVGATSTRPVVMDQIGQSFESNSEMRNYFKKHPGRQVVDKDSGEWRQMYDDTRNGCDTEAKAQGFRDVRHKQQTQKKERARKRALDTGLDTVRVLK